MSQAWVGERDLVRQYDSGGLPVFRSGHCGDRLYREISFDRTGGQKNREESPVMSAPERLK